MKPICFFAGSRRSDQLFYGREDFGEIDSRSPRRSVASPVDQCSPSNGRPRTLYCSSYFLFQRFRSFGPVAVGVHESAQLDERAHDSDVDFHSAPGAQDTRQHGNALLGKRVRAVACAAMLA